MDEDRLSRPGKAIAFDVDLASLASLRIGLPGWELQIVRGATADSLACDWNPGSVDLLVVGVRDQPAEFLGLCRFLAFCSSYSRDARTTAAERPAPRPRLDAPVLVLAPPDRQEFVRAALKAGAHSCLLLPIHPKDVASMLVHARQGNQPGRHTLNLERAQMEDPWRDVGGQG